MARVLLRDGWSVLVAPRDPSRAAEVLAAGATLLATPADVAARCELIVTCLPDTVAVREVVSGPDGVLAAGRWRGLLIDCSTLPPADAQALARDVERAGGRCLDAPVSGGPAAAEAGTLSIMVGGPADALERGRPVLESLGGRVIHCGSSGAGQVTKACNQLIVMSTVTAVAEALTVARHAGVDPWKVREALMGGYAASPILERHGDRILRQDWEAGGRAIFHAKDIATIAGLAAEHDLSLPLFEAARAQYEALFRDGGGDLDHSAVATRYPLPDPAQGV
jgi:2-hydroxy-3-oxopropionate reductase